MDSIACSDLQFELVFPRKCVTCDRVLGDTYIKYRELLRAGESHANILVKLGIRSACCTIGLPIWVKCDQQYRDSLIRESCITSGSSPLIIVTDFAHAVKAPKPRKLIQDTSTGGLTDFSNEIPVTFDQVLEFLQ